MYIFICIYLILSNNNYIFLLCGCDCADICNSGEYRTRSLRMVNVRSLSLDELRYPALNVICTFITMLPTAMLTKGNLRKAY